MMRRTINLLLMLLLRILLILIKYLKKVPVSKNRLNGPLSRNEHFL